MRKRSVTILCGCSGSGKSTYSRLFADPFIVSADRYFIDAERTYNFDPSKLSEAHAHCLRQYVEALQDTFTHHIIVDNTNTSVSEIAPYAALAQAYSYYGWELEIVWVKCDIETAAARNVHGVPAQTVARQADRLARTWKELPPWWSKRIHEQS